VNGEAKLREALESLFCPYDWHDMEGNAIAPSGSTVDAVLDVLKGGEWLITGGTVQHVWSARYDGSVVEHEDAWHQNWRVRTDG